MDPIAGAEALGYYVGQMWVVCWIGAAVSYFLWGKNRPKWGAYFIGMLVSGPFLVAGAGFAIIMLLAGDGELEEHHIASFKKGYHTSCIDSCELEPATCQTLCDCLYNDVVEQLGSERAFAEMGMAASEDDTVMAIFSERITDAVDRCVGEIDE